MTIIYKQGRKAEWSWAFIDWANSAFSLTVMTVFFPIFFADYWCKAEGMTPDKSTMYLGLANSTYAAMIALCAPVLGAIADQGRRKKQFLIAFTLLGALSTALMPLVAQGQYFLAAGLFTVAAFGFAGNNTFYDSLIMDVADGGQFDRVSSFGFSVGYLGSELLFILNTVMVIKPEWFGFSDKAVAIKASFLLTGVWWALFTIPAMLWIREEAPGARQAHPGNAISRGFSQFWKTFKELRKHKTAIIFLASYILYIDGVNTVISMAVDFGMKIGLDTTGLIISIHVVQIVAIPMTILYGRLGEKIGAKKSILFGILVYGGVCFWAYNMTTMREFWIMAIVVGSVQGGVQALSRSYFARLIPADKSGEFFGFYNMMGKFAAIVGPALMGISAAYVGPRASILSLLILFVAGSAILMRIKEEAAA